MSHPVAVYQATPNVKRTTDESTYDSDDLDEIIAPGIPSSPAQHGPRRNALLSAPSMGQMINSASFHVKKDISHLISNVKNDVENASTGKLVVWILIVYALALIIFFFWIPNSPEAFGLEPTKVTYADGFYYWATLTSTVGFGDICPKTVGTKIATGIYQVIMVLITAGAVTLIADKKMKKYFNLFVSKDKRS